MIKKRKPIIALLLSLLSPGFGHVYAGDLKKGFWLFLLQYGVIFLLGKLGFLSTAYGAWFFIAFLVCLYSYAMFSSVRLALANKTYELKSYNRWYWYLFVLVLVLACGQMLISFRGSVLGFEFYKIPSRSMMPTLQPGDYITVDTQDSLIKVGDVVVFRYPKNKQTLYAQRVVALGKDTVAIENGQVILNGKTELAASVDEDFRRNKVSTYMAETMVPEGQVFVLGDWRDNSSDSRYWGTVTESDVIGKVTYIWFSKDMERLGREVR
ncbi:signal peptidase I [Marinomonas sp. CT5]|uniref:signal peptidase I n=1 Tax=Marinomonas sp. CT5 TaxID=2066133 RepID=UPI001BAFFCCE|nr:signal peptidase I [Marinomonas sp. CT5]QUX97245.1 signal peptidase I [Marinomonas sp. CT5]